MLYVSKNWSLYYKLVTETLFLQLFQWGYATSMLAKLQGASLQESHLTFVFIIIIGDSTDFWI